MCNLPLSFPLPFLRFFSCQLSCQHRHHHKNTNSSSGRVLIPTATELQNSSNDQHNKFQRSTIGRTHTSKQSRPNEFRASSAAKSRSQTTPINHRTDGHWNGTNLALCPPLPGHPSLTTTRAHSHSHRPIGKSRRFSAVLVPSPAPLSSALSSLSSCPPRCALSSSPVLPSLLQFSQASAERSGPSLVARLVLPHDGFPNKSPSPSSFSDPTKQMPR